MRLVSWNVNGLRACLGKGFLDFCAVSGADVICLQETKMRPEQAEFDLPGFHRYWNSADKAGYSGTAVFTKEEPLAVTYDFGIDEHRHEGRVITAEYPAFFLVCCYTPNSKDQMARLDYRMAWEDDIRDYLLELDGKKPVVYCGDLDSGFVDTFRYLYPDKTGAYSWWSYRFNARKNNAGWRIDYFLVSERLKEKIRNADIWSEVLGSDHCPVMLELDV